jgi:hypothetical protein
MANRAEKTNPLQASLRQVRFFSANPARGIIRAHPRYLTRCAHPFRAAFGTLSRFARLWLIPLHALPASGLLSNKLVAEAFCLTGSIEKYGSGFIRIRKALEDYP